MPCAYGSKQGMRPEVRIFAAEPAAADDCARSMAKGERVLLQSYPRRKEGFTSCLH